MNPGGVTRPERTPRAVRKARTRRALLEAAARCFARDGFAGARVEAVAAEAGVTTGALYAHFEGKEALFLAVYEVFAAQRSEEVAHAGDGARTRPLSLRAAADQWMARFEAEPWLLLLHIEFAGHALHDAKLRADFALRVGEVRGAVARLIERERADSRSELPMDVASLAAVIRALGIGLAAERLIDPEAVAASLFGDFIDLLFGLLAAAGPRA